MLCGIFNGNNYDLKWKNIPHPIIKRYIIDDRQIDIKKNKEIIENKSII